MNQALLDILIFAAIALFLFFKLRNVLGEVDEQEDLQQKKPTQRASTSSKQTSSDDRLAKLNPQEGPGIWPSTLPDFKLVTNATAHNALLHFHTVEPKFDPYHFLDGAKRAFPMIIEAFSKGDKKTLKNLLSTELYDGYSEAIDERIEKGETWYNEIVDFNTVTISDAEIEGSTATITVDYESVEKITARDKEGNFIDGQDGSEETSQDRWSFTQDLKSKDHIWKLTKTQEVGGN